MLYTLQSVEHPTNRPGLSTLNSDCPCSRCKKLFEASSSKGISCYCCGQLCCPDCIEIDSGLLPDRDQPEEHVCKDCYVYDEKTGRGTWNSDAYKMARLKSTDRKLLESHVSAGGEHKGCIILMEKPQRRPPSMVARKTLSRSF